MAIAAPTPWLEPVTSALCPDSENGEDGGVMMMAGNPSERSEWQKKLVCPSITSYAAGMNALPPFLIGVLCSSVCLAQAPDFESKIAPILEARCLACHDANHSSGDVSLQTREQALPVLSPGDVEASVFIQQIVGPDHAMPKDGPPLTADEIQSLSQWIAAGALWPMERVLKDKPIRDLNWWSLLPIQSHTPPANAIDEARNPVDAFLDAKLAAQGLSPVPPADAQTLLRRLTYDLTGLPPTLEEQDSFFTAIESEGLEQAYIQKVDTLLASHAFAEHWARHWLDVARYGETHGYDKDQPRLNAWPYRDYVIQSFHSDKPYPRFVQEQIAGDALFPNDPDGILGLGFLAAGPWDLIGHVEVGEQKVDGRIAKHLDRDEMIAAVFNVFTSTTVQCAQCHHHKFDPITTEDYYRLHAVFAAVDRADRIYEGLSPDQHRSKSQLVAQIKEIQTKRDQLDASLEQEISRRAKQLDERIAALKQSQPLDRRPQFGWHSLISLDETTPKWVQVDLGNPVAVSLIKLRPAYDDFAGIGPGFGFPQRFKVEACEEPNFENGVLLLKEASDSDASIPRGSVVTIEGPALPVRFIRVTATQLAPRQNDFIFALDELQLFGPAEATNPKTDSADNNLALNATVSSIDSIENPPRWSRNNLTDGIYYLEAANDQALAELQELRGKRKEIEDEIRTREATTQLKAIDDELTALSKRLEAYPVGKPVYAVATDFPAQGQHLATKGTPREIRLLVRGDIRNTADIMQPGMSPLWPSAPGQFELSPTATESDARAALATSITSQDNPLLWRSIVNRLWQWTFGQALVGSPNDFGRMGMTPTHPELLDWLAAKLRDDPKHSLKSIIHLMVTSDAYKRSCDDNEINRNLDAGNACLWRANRRRLSAEEIRDSILAIAGSLRLEERGGPSFQDFVIDKPQHSPHYEYHLHDPNDEKTHRRSIYRFVVRSQPQPFLTTLDCADPSLSVAARDESTTAIQALTQWNNRLVETFSLRLAARLDRENSDFAKVDAACRLALGRLPTQAERAALLEHLQQHGTPSLARVVFNLNAFIYVD
jgi:hypothetical protein